jgi:hypothetical protein
MQIYSWLSMPLHASVRSIGWRLCSERAMSKSCICTAMICAGLFISVAMSAASAQTAYTSLRAQCHKEAGAYWNPDRRTWRYRGGRGSPQRQAFYACLDARMAGRR